MLNRRVTQVLRLLLGVVWLASVTMGVESNEKRWTELTRRPGQGEICIVCDEPIPPDTTAVVLRHRGRRVYVSEPFYSDWVTDPDRYFAEKQARGWLFDEQAIVDGRVNQSWLWGAAYVLAGLIFGGVCGYLAVHRGRRPAVWFFLGLLFNVMALVAVMCWPRRDAEGPEGVPPGLRKVPLTYAPCTCAQCNQPNHPSAGECMACGTALRPRVEGDMARLSVGGQV